MGDPADGDLRLRFTYDHLGRRVRKLVEEYNAAQQQWQTVADVKFVYHGWRLLMERDGMNEGGTGVPPVIRSYTWGPDLSGLVGPVSNRSSLDGAGGIGGLLATYDTQGTVTTSDDEKYLYFYDANGNVGQVVNYQATPTTFYWSTKAHYQYSPYGTVLSMTGDYAEENPFRFSTKYHDDETGFVYFGFRYYVPWLGRWLNRDPIGENDSPNVHVFLRNGPLQGVDYPGLGTYRVGRDLYPKPPFDKGSGPHGSRPATLDDHGARSEWFRNASRAADLSMDDAAAHMRHYLGNTGQKYRVDVCGMVSESPSAKKHLYQEMNHAMTFAESVLDKPFFWIVGTWTRGSNPMSENWNWYYAVHGYSACGRAAVTKHKGSGCRYKMAFYFMFSDKYNWDKNKAVTIAGETVKDVTLGALHEAGIAQEFEMYGFCKKAVEWCAGERFDGTGTLRK